MNLNYQRYQDFKRQGETKVATMIRPNLFSDYYNLPIVPSVKQSTSPTKPTLKIKPIPFVAEKFVKSEIFDDNDNSKALQSLLLKNCQQQEVTKVPRIHQANRVDKIIPKEQEEVYKRAHTISERIEKKDNPQIKEQEKNIYLQTNRSVSRRKRYHSIQVTNFQNLNCIVDCPLEESNNQSQAINKLHQEDQYSFLETSTLRKATIMLEHEQPLIEIEKLFRYENFRSPLLRSKFYKKFKLIALLVKAVIRISQKIRQQKKQKLLQYKAVLNLREPHYNHVIQYGLKNLKGEHLKYIRTVSNKMLHFFMDRKYINECKQIWNKTTNVEKDVRRTRLSAFSQMFLQNLELLTRRDNLPILIQHELNNCLFKTKDMQISQFVSKRSNIYSKKITQLSFEEKVLLASEFFVYQVVIPNLLQLVNDIHNTCAAHQNQTMFYCFGLSSMMQIFFTNHFSSMKEIQTTNITPIQRRVLVKTQESDGMMNVRIEIDKQLENDETQILFGCFQRGSIVDIFYQKPEWNEKMKKLFSQLVSNLQQQIRI